MTDPASPQPADRPTPNRPSAMVSSSERAEAVIVDLTERGIPREHVTVRLPGHDGQAAPSSRTTGELDTVQTEQAGKRMGSRALIGGAIGAAVGFALSLLLFGAPWENGVAAGLTIAVTIGIGYIVGGVGLLQGGISAMRESGDAPLGYEGTDNLVIEVEADDTAQVTAAREVFSSHGADPVG
jgi:hypothetical protein